MAELTQDILYAIPRKNAEASTEITYGYLVKWDTNGCKICTTSDVPMGVAMKATFEDSNNVVRVIDATHTVGNIRVGDYATVCQLGVCTAKLGTGDSVTAGSPIALSDTNDGCVDGWVAGRDCLGYALETSSTAGDVKVFISTVEPVEIPSLTAYLTSTTAATTYEPIMTITDLSADGAVTIPSTKGHHIMTISKAGVCALTIADPTAITHDGMKITFVSQTANAHTLDNSGGSSFNGATGTLTMKAAIGDSFTIVADGGVWYVNEDLVNVAGTYLASATAATTYQPIMEVEELTADGAITITNGWVQLNKAGVLAATLANPTVEGLRLSIRSMTAQAHTLTVPSSPGIDGGGVGVGTFGGAVGDGVTLYSRDVSGTLRWCEEVGTNVNVTWA